VENRDEVFLRDIAALLEKLELSTNAKDHRQFVKLNYEFHLRIYTQSRSSTLVDMIETLWLRVSPHLYFAERDKQFKVSNEHHQQVVNMIRNGDADRAAKAIRDDISDAYEMLLRNISS
jgi:DNA-binding GntR family transcriptional regulator